MLRTLFESVSTYNKLMYKNKYIKRTNNKINDFF